MSRRVVILLLAVAVSGCGYFNSLYNARRSFGSAQRAAARGDNIAARQAYNEAIDKAAVSYRRYPHSRWADDALFLITRARFALDQNHEAAAAAARLLDSADEPSMRAAAHAYRGAALFRLGTVDSARSHLDSAVVHTRAGSDTDAFARLWRARVAFRQGRTDDGWADLARAGTSAEVVFEASIDAAMHAAEARDSARLAAAFARLAQASFNARSAAPLVTLLERTAAGWSPRIAFAASASFDDAEWRSDLVDDVMLARAGIALAAADSAAALALAERVAQAVTGGTGSSARRLAARLRLARLDDAEDLEQIRQLLLPAFDDAEALQLMRHVRALQILAARGYGGSALSLFAAAEHARDDVLAPRLARRLFLDFAEREPDNVWMGKALLAAHALDNDDRSRAALDGARANVYVRAAHGDRAADFTLAEERLARGLAGIRADALVEAVQSDVVVGRALTLLDSTRSSARLDSLRIACGTLIDSLKVHGIRADSLRSACLRADTARVSWVLRVDTTLLRDTVAPHPMKPLP